MSIFTDSLDGAVEGAVGTSNATEILNKNLMTTAGVLVGTSTVLASTALVAAAIPAQVLVATGASAGLIYAGDRQHKGLPLNPWAKPEEKSVTTEAEATA